MKIMIPFKNPKTGEIKEVKLGFSWTLFLFSGVFGLPLFMRKLNVWGSIFLVLWAVNLTVVPYETKNAALSVLLFIICAALQIWLGSHGNQMTAKNYLERDWLFAEPDSEFTKLAKKQWKINV